MPIYRYPMMRSARPFSLAAPKCDWKAAFLSDVRPRVLQRATDVGFANGDFVLLAAVRAFDFDGAPPAGPEAVRVGLNAGRCSLIGVGANEKKRKH
jgi:hypothetical protein